MEKKYLSSSASHPTFSELKHCFFDNVNYSIPALNTDLFSLKQAENVSLPASCEGEQNVLQVFKF